MHRPDHLSHSTSHCYKDGKCQFGFPKLLQETTKVDDSGRVIYRRCKDEDKMVVSYMPFLTELMDYHVNVDVTFTVNIFMYLYKYLFKGPDDARYAITNSELQRTNKLQDFVNARYVSATEATWRIFGFETTRMMPTVTSLPVHLPGGNYHPMSQKNGNASMASKLLRYFAHPTAPQFQSLMYTDFYSKYIHKPLTQAGIINPNQWLKQPSADINVPQNISA